MSEQDYTDSPEGQNALAQAYEDARVEAESECPMTAPSAEQIRALYRAIDGVIYYRQHVTGCEITQTDFCTCGMREAMEALDAAWKALSQSFTEAQGEIARLDAEAQAYAEKIADQQDALASLTEERNQLKADYEESATFLSQANDELSALTAAHERVKAELRTMARVAGQASVETLDDKEAAADARFAEYCTRWADQLDALASPEGTPK